MEQRELRAAVTVRIMGAEGRCFGPGVAELLELVDRTGSLRKAALEMDMAYSKAWRITKTAAEKLGFDLLISDKGGRGGGGARLTDRCRAFLAEYRALEKELDRLAAERFEEMKRSYEIQ